MREISIRQEEQSRSRRTDHSAYLSDHSSIHLTIHPVQIITTSPKRMNMHVRWYLFKWKTFILLLLCCLAAAPRNPRSGLPSFIILWGWFGTFSTINIIIPAGCRKRQRSNLFLFSSSLEIYLYLWKMLHLLQLHQPFTWSQVSLIFHGGINEWLTARLAQKVLLKGKLITDFLRLHLSCFPPCELKRSCPFFTWQQFDTIKPFRCPFCRLHNWITTE